MYAYIDIHRDYTHMYINVYVHIYICTYCPCTLVDSKYNMQLCISFTLLLFQVCDNIAE